MKAVFCTRYGAPESIDMRDIEAPRPKAGEVLVEVYASSVNYNSLLFATGRPLVARPAIGILRPGIAVPGNDVAGRVVACGEGTTLFRAGDCVYGDTSLSGFGAWAEYVSVPETAMSPVPEGISLTDAAAVPEAGLVALQALRNHARVQPGDRVIIFGASGGIGTFAVQLARYLGAKVTAVCSARNIELVKSLGATEAIDYNRTSIKEINEKYEVVIATAGYNSLLDYRRLLKTGGRYIATGGLMSQIFEALLLGPPIAAFTKPWSRQLLKAMMVKPNEDLGYLGGLLAAGAIRPVIDRVFPFDSFREALNYYMTGKAQGKVVIEMHKQQPVI